MDTDRQCVPHKFALVVLDRCGHTGPVCPSNGPKFIGAVRKDCFPDTKAMVGRVHSSGEWDDMFHSAENKYS